MRYREIASGFRVPVSGEEQDLIGKIATTGTAEAALTDERDQELALRLLRRGVLDKRRDKQGNVVYHRNSISDIRLDRN